MEGYNMHACECGACEGAGEERGGTKHGGERRNATEEIHTGHDDWYHPIVPLLQVTPLLVASHADACSMASHPCRTHTTHTHPHPHTHHAPVEPGCLQEAASHVPHCVKQH